MSGLRSFRWALSLGGAELAFLVTALLRKAPAVEAFIDPGPSGTLREKVHPDIFLLSNKFLVGMSLGLGVLTLVASILTLRHRKENRAWQNITALVINLPFLLLVGALVFVVIVMQSFYS